MTDLLSDVLVAVFVAVFAVFLALAVAGMVCAARAFAQADRADAQPDYTPPDGPDPVDAADDTLPDWISRLRDDTTACEPSVLIDEIYAFLKEQAK
jgi:hypothetical protein